MSTVANRKEFTKAVRLLQKYTGLIQAGKATANTYFQRGTIHQQLRMLEAALKDYDAALSAHPTLDTQTLALIFDSGNTCQRDLGRYHEAVIAGREAVRLAPHQWEYHVNLVISQYGAGDYEGTLADVDAALELCPDNSQLWSLRGWSHYQLGDLESALDEFNESLIKEEIANTFLGRGLVYYAVGHEVAAQADFDQFASLHPAGPDAASRELARYIGGAD